jgi:hypothetical protein
MLRDPEFHVRVRRRVGPALWGAVRVILLAAAAVAELPLDQPDPWDPKLDKPKN